MLIFQVPTDVLRAILIEGYGFPRHLSYAYTLTRRLRTGEPRAVVPLLIYRYITDIPAQNIDAPGRKHVDEVRSSLRVLRAILDAAPAIQADLEEKMQLSEN